MIKLSIVILSYNTKDLTLACLKSVISQYGQELERQELEIIIVDNSSNDDSVRAIKQEFAGKDYLNLVEGKENLGFGKGSNLGARKAKGKYLLFLNSDTQVFDKGFLSMIAFLDQNKSVAILGGKIENNDGSPQSSAGKFYNLPNLFFMLLGLERFGFLRSSPDKIQRVDWVSGACMMVRRDVFKKLTGFDGEIFMYVEDMEICFRARKLGFMTYFYPNISLKHKSFGSSSRTFAIINIYKGILHFYSKHRPYWEYLIAKILLTFKAIFLIFVGLLTFNSEMRNTYKKAIS